MQKDYSSAFAYFERSILSTSYAMDSGVHSIEEFIGKKDLSPEEILDLRRKIILCSFSLRLLAESSREFDVRRNRFILALKYIGMLI